MATIAIAASLAATFLLGSATVFAAKQPKVSVCHYDRTLATYVVLNVAEVSKHLAHGDYLVGAGLAGESAYAIAWTETDGVAGFSGCENLIAALVEDSGNSEPSAGDKVIFGRYPTAFSAPFGFAAFPAATATVASVTCGADNIQVGVGGVLGAAWYMNAGGAFVSGEIGSEDTPANLTALLDYVGGGSLPEFSDHIIVVSGGVEQVHALKPDEGDNPWLEVGLSGTCVSS